MFWGCARFGPSFQKCLFGKQKTQKKMIIEKLIFCILVFLLCFCFIFCFLFGFSGGGGAFFGGFKGQVLRWAKTRVLKADARIETRVLKTLACRNGFWTSFKQW